MPTTYIEILSNQSPFDNGADEHLRPQITCNYRTRLVAPSDKFEEEIVQLLVAAGIATLGTDTFIGRDVKLPAGDGPYTRLVTTGGAPPQSVHGTAAASIERPSCQITVSATKYRTARTRALAIWRALQGVRNTQVTAA